MKTNKYKLVYLLFDIILILLLCLSVANNFMKPTIFPESISYRDTITKINNTSVNDIIEAEYLTDLHPIGDKIYVEHRIDGKNYSETRTLIPYYDLKLGIILVLTVLIYVILAIYVIRIKFSDFESRVFHNVAFSAALLIGMTWGGINHFPLPIDFFLRLMYDASYLWLGVNLLKFSMVFPRDKSFSKTKYFLPLYVLIFVLIIITGYLLFLPEQKESIKDFRIYWDFHSNVIIPIFVLFILGSIASFIHSYLAYNATYERQKIRWIMIGVFIATINFTVLWLIPKHIFHTRWEDEATMLLLTLPAPLSMFISIVKYRIFNIDLLLSKATLYTLFAALLFGLYSLIIPLTGLPDTNIIISFSFTTIAAFVLFKYFNRRIQNLIDMVLFKEKFDQRKINETYSLKTNNSYSDKEATDILFKALIDSRIFDRIQLFVLELKTLKILHIRTSEETLLKRDPIIFSAALYGNEIYSHNNIVIADKNAIEKDLKYVSMNDTVFADLGYKLVIISFSVDRGIAIIVGIGDNIQRVKFSWEDIESILYKTGLAVNVIYKIHVMNEISLRDEENKKLKELNDMKSWFVSSVSHELKTPLTSIKMFSEILEANQNLKREKIDEYLGIIQQECDRLTRLINNVLDFSKIEKGVRQLNLHSVDLVAIIEHSLSLMSDDLYKNGFTVDKYYQEPIAFILGDRDSLIEVFINLFNNSIKYSAQNKHISIRLTLINNNYQVVIADKGIGISAKNLDFIFEPFFRVKSEKTSHQGGTGIGLSIVKNIILSHKGTITADSELGTGTRFIINIPSGEADE